MLKEWFYFQRSDRRVIMLLLAILLIGGVAWFAVKSDRNNAVKDTLAYTNKESSRNFSQGKYQGYAVESKVKTSLFAFDPNTADSTALLQLGLSPWQVRAIYRYRAAGGVYRRPEDFAKLYGLTLKQYRSLEPYIRIAPDYQPASLYVDNRQTIMGDATDSVSKHLKLAVGETIDLNDADTTVLKKVPGIGSYFARQIVYYREQLGGFVDKEQVLEIEDFPAKALPYLVLRADAADLVRKINLNEATLNQLRRHPYINFYQARAIVDYRRLKGKLHSLNDLRLHKDFSPSVMEQLKPYVAF